MADRSAGTQPDEQKMGLKAKLIAAALAVLLVFGGGVYTGYHIQKAPTQGQLETVFTPYEDGLAAYLNFLDRAEKSVHIAVYTFTDPRIYDKLLELHARGVKDIHVLIDLSQTRGWSGDDIDKGIGRLRAAGIEVVIGTSEKNNQIMHSKYTIVDGVWVEDGSWNYTKLANRQANYLNFSYDSRRGALFMANWRRMHAFMKAQQDAREAAEKAAPRKR